MPQKKKDDKIPVPRVSASRAKTTDPAPLAASAELNGAATAAAKVKSATSKARKSAASAATDSLLKLNGAVNGHATSAQIAERAYFLWLEKGCPEGTADQDWVEAERLLTAH